MTDFNEWEQTLFQLILHAGSARSFAKEAAENAEAGHWEEAEKVMQQANEEQVQAHKINTAIITKAARGENPEFSVLLVHALGPVDARLERDRLHRAVHPHEQADCCIRERSK
jgi:Phosphotransferase system cellobiose-specific component IIA